MHSVRIKTGTGIRITLPANRANRPSCFDRTYNVQAGC